jgi:hypothetical protein
MFLLLLFFMIFTVMKLKYVFLVVNLLLTITLSAQTITRYENFELKEGELYWRYIYNYSGNADSLRREVVQLLKSKSFTNNVIRNELGYNGELDHYMIDCERYHRKYIQTPRMFWEGEWSGKFIVEIKDNRYRVTVYALSYEIKEATTFTRQLKNPSIKKRYVNVVKDRHKTGIRKSEFENMAFLGLSLKDQFDIKNLKPIVGEDW